MYEQSFHSPSVQRELEYIPGKPMSEALIQQKGFTEWLGICEGPRGWGGGSQASVALSEPSRRLRALPPLFICKFWGQRKSVTISKTDTVLTKPGAWKGRRGRKSSAPSDFRVQSRLPGALQAKAAAVGSPLPCWERAHPSPSLLFSFLPPGALLVAAGSFLFTQLKK